MYIICSLIPPRLPNAVCHVYGANATKQDMDLTNKVTDRKSDTRHVMQRRLRSDAPIGRCDDILQLFIDANTMGTRLAGIYR